MKTENQFLELFEEAALVMEKEYISNEELRLCIKVLEAMERFFRLRGPYYGLIKSEISKEFDRYQGFAIARGIKVN
jgi:hypothetical protein